MFNIKIVWNIGTHWIMKCKCIDRDLNRSTMVGSIQYTHFEVFVRLRYNFEQCA